MKPLQTYPPTVGIVTTVWSYEKFLPGWCESIRNLQRQPDSVVIAAHNASSVSSIVQNELPEAIVVQVDDPFVLGHYLNKAVEACHTDWIGWIGADDRYRPEAFNGIDSTEEDILSFGMKYSDGREWHYQNDLHNVLHYNPIPCGSPFRRWIWERLPFQPSLMPFEDWAFWTGAHILGAQAKGTGRIDFDYAMHDEQNAPPLEPTASKIRAWAHGLVTSNQA